MGWGDEIISTGLARGAKARGKRIAFGDGKRIMWGPWCEQMFAGNPNIARPGDERSIDIEWVHHYKGHRLYVRTHGKRRWVFNPQFSVIPGEIFFDQHEKDFADNITAGFVLIEPRVKPCYPNKQWPVERYVEVAQRLIAAGFRVAQFVYDGENALLCDGVEPILTPKLRLALAALSRADLFIGPEGALAHGAAAVGIKSVVLFGGFSPPSVVGYSANANLTGGATHCGWVMPCMHCRRAMNAISVDRVCQSALEFLNAGALSNDRELGERKGLDQGRGAGSLQRRDALLSAQELPAS